MIGTNELIFGVIAEELNKSAYAAVWRTERSGFYVAAIFGLVEFLLYVWQGSDPMARIAPLLFHMTTGVALTIAQRAGARYLIPMTLVNIISHLTYNIPWALDL